MQNHKKNNSNLPLVIIGLVLAIAVVGGWWLYSSSKAKPAPKSNTNITNKNPEDAAKAALAFYQSAPAGAQPANMLGASTLPVTVEEFADFQCPTCATVHTKMKEINSLYSGRIKFIYRNFPLPMHKNAYDASTAAEAAGLQQKFWAMQDQLFSNQKAWSDSTPAEARKLFEEYAGKIGLDTNKFQSDMMGLQTKKRVDDDLARGNALKITGTPTVFVNGVRLAFEQMDVAAMRQIIDNELAKASQVQPSQPTTQTVNAANQSANTSSGNSANKQ